MLHENFTHALMAFGHTEIKLKVIKPMHHWIQLFMESKKSLVLCSHSKEYMSYWCLFTMQ